MALSRSESGLSLYTKKVLYVQQGHLYVQQGHLYVQQGPFQV